MSRSSRVLILGAGYGAGVLFGWQRLESLFFAACDLPDAERSAFIERETAGDEELRRDLTGMLTHASNGAVRIARAIDEIAGVLPERSSWVGRRLGPYRVIREIGRGGMGLVFEAVRDDDEYRKTVAIKIAPSTLSDARPGRVVLIRCSISGLKIAAAAGGMICASRSTKCRAGFGSRNTVGKKAPTEARKTKNGKIARKKRYASSAASPSASSRTS